MQQINLTENVKIEFTPQQLQVVMTMLGEGIHKIVNPILATIEQQVFAQYAKSLEYKKKEQQILSEIKNSNPKVEIEDKTELIGEVLDNINHK